MELGTFSPCLQESPAIVYFPLPALLLWNSAFCGGRKDVKILGKTGDTGITSMSKLCAVTVYILKRKLKENSFLWRVKELNVKRPEWGAQNYKQRRKWWVSQNCSRLRKKLYGSGYWNFEERWTWQQLQLNTAGKKSPFYTKYSNPWVFKSAYSGRSASACIAGKRTQRIYAKVN